MHRKSQQRGNRNQERIPIQNAGFLAGGEIGPQRQEEFAGPVEWYTPNHVAERGAEENREQCAGAGEYCVPQRLPDEALYVIAKLDGDAAQDQEPEHDHQRQIEPAEARRVERREREVEGPTTGKEPYFVSVPDGAD